MSVIRIAELEGESWRMLTGNRFRLLTDEGMVTRFLKMGNIFLHREKRAK
jgi:hypothetical protein